MTRGRSLSVERRRKKFEDKILEYIEKNPTCSVVEMSEYFDMTPPSIARYVNGMGLVKTWNLKGIKRC